MYTFLSGTLTIKFSVWHKLITCQAIDMQDMRNPNICSHWNFLWNENGNLWRQSKCMPRGSKYQTDITLYKMKIYVQQPHNHKSCGKKYLSCRDSWFTVHNKNWGKHLGKVIFQQLMEFLFAVMYSVYVQHNCVTED